MKVFSRLSAAFPAAFCQYNAAIVRRETAENGWGRGEIGIHNRLKIWLIPCHEDNRLKSFMFDCLWDKLSACLDFCGVRRKRRIFPPHLNENELTLYVCKTGKEKTWRTHLDLGQLQCRGQHFPRFAGLTENLFSN